MTVTTQRGEELAAVELAAATGGPGEGTENDAGAPVRARAHARARVAATKRDRKRLPVAGLLAPMWADWRGAWWWTSQPADLATIVAGRRPTGDAVPEGSLPLRVILGVWLHAVAIPATWLLLPIARYAGPLRQPIHALVWVLQRPDRAALAAGLVGPTIYMITNS